MGWLETLTSLPSVDLMPEELLRSLRGGKSDKHKLWPHVHTDEGTLPCRGWAGLLSPPAGLLWPPLSHPRALATAVPVSAGVCVYFCLSFLYPSLENGPAGESE